MHVHWLYIVKLVNDLVTCGPKAQLSWVYYNYLCGMLKGGREGKTLAPSKGRNEHTTGARSLGIDWQWNTNQFWLAHRIVCVTNACDHAKLWTVKPYSLPYSMSQNQHVISHSLDGCPINLNKLVFIPIFRKVLEINAGIDQAWVTVHT